MNGVYIYISSIVSRLFLSNNIKKEGAGVYDSFSYPSTNFNC
jgi:hypothetical protein